LKLPPSLKKRIAPLAKSAGKSPHAWMVAALERATEREELHEQFIEDSLAAAADIDAGGPVYAGEEVHAYIIAKAAGRKVRRPKPIRGRRPR